MRKSLYEWCQENGEYGQYVINNWLGIEVDNNGCIIKKNVNIYDVSYGTSKKFNFMCDNGHVYMYDIHKMTYSRSKCNICGKEKAIKSHIDTTIKLTDSKDPFINIVKDQWTGIEVDSNNNVINTDIKIDNIPIKSTRRFRFKCSNNHVYCSTIINKMSNHVICPKCSLHGASFPEILIYRALKQIDKSVEHRVKVLKNLYDGGLEFDIAIPSKRTCIEYSPSIWHSNKNRDNIKRNECNSRNIRLIEIIDDTSINRVVYSNNKIITPVINGSNYNIINDVIVILCNILSLNYNMINMEQAYIDTYKDVGMDNSDSDTLKNKYPTLFEEVYNKEMYDRIHYGSHSKIDWVCSHCGYVWNTSVSSRTHNKSGCRNCGWNCFTQRYENTALKQDTIKDKMQSLYEEINNNLNRQLGIDIDNLTLGQHKKLYCICSNCGYGKNGEWFIDIHTRTNSKFGCKKCGYNIFTGKYNKRFTNINKNNIAISYPSLTEEFNNELNSIKPDELTPGNSKYKIYWTCTKCGYGRNGEWCTTVNSRTYKNTGCPNCHYNIFRKGM